MAQYTLPVPNGAGSAVRANINSALEACYTGHSGTSAPASPKLWQTWTDTSVSPPVERQWDGTSWQEKAQEQRITVADANYTISTTGNRIVAYTSITAGRTLTLPPASGRAGQRIVVLDESGNASASAQITIQRAGSDTVSGFTSIAIAAPYGAVTLLSNGTSRWTMERSRLRRVTFTSSGTWTCPAGVDLARVLCVGGGGGGSVQEDSPAYGNGGGGGAIVEKTVPVTPGTPYTITVGAGGAGGWTTTGDGQNHAGNSGGSSSFGSLVTAVGGQGGQTTAGGTAGNMLSGAGGSGELSESGRPSLYASGGALYTNSTNRAGGGGGSWGAGAAGYSANVTGQAPAAAVANTGGGGGGYASLYHGTGGAGGSGIVIVEWFE